MTIHLILGVQKVMLEGDVNSNPDQVFKDDDQKNLQKLFMNMMGWSQNDYDKINTTYISKKKCLNS